MRESMRTLLAWVPRAFCGLGLVLAASTAFAGQVTYYHNDLAGSPVAATNASGQVIWRESYRPYGERLTNAPASSGNKVWFTSRRQDAETGLVYMGARYYDPHVGHSFPPRSPSSASSQLPCSVPLRTLEGRLVTSF